MTASWVALLRLARRDARRHRGRALLVVMLIAAPVAGLIMAATVQATVTPTDDERARQALGSGDLAVQSADGAVAPTAVAAQLPADARVDRYWQGETTFDGVRAPVPTVGVDLKGVGAGLFEITAGRAPRPNVMETALTERVMRQTGNAVGATMTTPDGPLTVVGRARDPLQLDRRAAIMPVDHPTASAAGLLIDLPDGADATAVSSRLERAEWQISTREDLATQSAELLLIILMFGGFGFVVTVLVTAAAFAVSAQRRRRELALLAAGGAEPRHLRTSVLASAVVLGAVGTTLGVAAGLALAAATLPWLDDLSNQAITGLHIVPALVVGVAATGFTTAVAAAWLSARSAARTPIAAALARQRPTRTPSRRVLVVGVISVLAGLGGTVLVTTVLTDNEVATAAGLLLSTALVMVGLGATSPWLLERLSDRLGHRVSVGVRLALRDAARLRSRTAPIVIAIVAGLGLSVAVGATVDMMSRGLVSDYRPRLADDQLLVDGPAPIPLVRQLQADLPVRTAARLRTIRPVIPSQGPLPMLVTITDGDLLEALDAPPDAVRALDAGRVLVLADADGPADPADSVAQADLLAPDGTYPVEVPLAPTAVASIAMSADTLDRLGGRPAQDTVRWLLTLDSAVTLEHRDTARRLAATFNQQVAVETGPRSIDAAVIQTAAVLGAGGLSILIVAIGLALLAAETRHDEHLLTLVGAAPRVSRAVAAARAGVLTFIGGVLAVPAGLLPIWGLTASAGANSAAGLAVPWVTVIAVSLIVPALAAAGAWLLNGVTHRRAVDDPYARGAGWNPARA